MVVDGLQQQFGLAAVPGVDGASGDAGPSGYLGHTCLLVALLGEHLGRSLE